MDSDELKEIEDKTLDDIQEEALSETEETQSINEDTPAYNGPMYQIDKIPHGFKHPLAIPKSKDGGYRRFLFEGYAYEVYDVREKRNRVFVRCLGRVEFIEQLPDEVTQETEENQTVDTSQLPDGVIVDVVNEGSVEDLPIDFVEEDANPPEGLEVTND